MNLEYIFYINATPEKIWSIITGPQSSQIFYGAEIESSFEINSDVKYVGPGRDGDKTLHIYGKVLDYKPLEVFKMTSHVGQVYRGDNPSYTSVIEYKLIPFKNYTGLKVTHSNWDPKDPSYENTKENWWLMLSNIKSLAETNQPLILDPHQ